IKRRSIKTTTIEAATRIMDALAIVAIADVVATTITPASSCPVTPARQTLYSQWSYEPPQWTYPYPYYPSSTSYQNPVCSST
ncbi:predicted protein, partial [Arabidopsis lyrata subsp. lyrata]